IRNLSMKKFGTPTFAAPGGASVYVGSVGAGGRSGAGLGVAVTWGTAPVSDCTLPAGGLAARGTSPEPCLTGLPAAGLPWFAPPLPEPAWLRAGGGGGGGRGGGGVGVGERVAVGVGEAVTAAPGVWVGVGMPSADPRSTIEDTGAGRPGICTWLTGVPSGTSTVTVSCWPVTSVTRT